MITWVSVVFIEGMWGNIDSRFDNLSGSHLQSQTSEDDFRSSCWKVSQCHLKQSFYKYYTHPGDHDLRLMTWPLSYIGTYIHTLIEAPFTGLFSHNILKLQDKAKK